MGSCFSSTKDDPSVGSYVHRFTYNELSAATLRFNSSRFLGKGSFGSVYRGDIPDWTSKPGEPGRRREVAVKMLDEDSFQGLREWLAEILLLGRLQHPHLVRLLGCCTKGHNAFLVYELMACGALDDWTVPSDPTRLLSWEQRTRIAWETACGLAYLHAQEPPIIHRDLKSGNILLDQDLTAKLTDFGMARVGPDDGKTHITTRVMGTMGYLDPEYLETGHLTAASDIYSFGVILLELLTGRASEWDRGTVFLASWAKSQFSSSKPRLEDLVDPKLDGRFSRSGAAKLAEIAMKCLESLGDARPTAQELVFELKDIHETRCEETFG